MTIIDTLLERKQPFAVYRLPGDKHPRLLTQTEGTVRQMYDLTELNGQQGFVIAPFRTDKQTPIVLIQPDRPGQLLLPDREEEDEDEDWRTQVNDVFRSTASPEYAKCFSTFIQALRNDTFDKLVLSRKLTVARNRADSSLSALFRAACKHYTYSYTYLCYTPQTGVWLGSTPEIILSGEHETWNTVALAGTQPLLHGELPRTWNEKNRKEQEYVTTYIRRQLLALDIHAIENGPYPAYAGALSHLKTDFRFTLKDNRRLGELLKVLHPTPAVCGLPKEEAYLFIQANEGYDRRYYTGFIGWMDPQGRTDLYVNLRCMNIGEQELTLYAGGGLLPSSELEDEWQETEKKLQTMRRIV
ncbi:MAG: isochorismate synthase [Bacteroides sp.]|nr:isochorismate synthase [Bacteroides sp.]